MQYQAGMENDSATNSDRINVFDFVYKFQQKSI